MIEEHQSSEGDYVLVYTTYGHLSGEMIRLMLESMGIPSFVSQESAGMVYGLTIGRLGEARIYVPADHAEEATKILELMERGELETQAVPGQDDEINQFAEK